MKILSQKKSSGFTLVEIIVVIAIIAGLAAISMVAYNKVYQTGSEKGTKARISSISGEVESYYSQYPDDLALPTGNGDADSTIALYIYLTGDDDLNGSINGAEVNGPFPSLKPPLDSSNNPNFEDHNCMVTSTYQIRDLNRQPLRYLQPGVKNSFTNGFDLWSSGIDESTDADPTATTDIMKDDIGNW